MKNFFPLAILIALFIGCKTDPCKDVVCMNNGVCVDGTCDCPPGYSGANCEDDLCAGIVCLNGGVCVGGVCDCDDGYEGSDCGTVVRDKFIGSYIVADACSVTGTSSYTTAIVSGTAITEVNISNFWDAFNNPVVATVDGNDISIASQEPDGDGFFVSGSGTISGNVISWSYTITDGVDTDLCTSTWTM